MGRRDHPPEFRRKVLDLLEEDGRTVASVAHDLAISAESIYTGAPPGSVPLKDRRILVVIATAAVRSVRSAS